MTDPWIPIVRVDYHDADDDGIVGWSLDELALGTVVFAEDSELDKGRLARLVWHQPPLPHGSRHQYGLAWNLDLDQVGK